tara:strand:- start:4502 stop:5647 length:1146 start_codon:yes stop_codon:yes gene_type:complete
MKKKIVILGSTGSIGKTLLDIISKDKKNFEILLLSTNKNYKKLFKQANAFNVKNLIAIDRKAFKELKKKNKDNKFNIFNNFDSFNKIFKKKIDYTMSSIIGLDGLKPTVDIIKYTKKIVIANKESIVCGWDLIKKELDKHNSEFIPVDSEHFSMWHALKDKKIKNVEKIYLTASGGPFLKKSIKNIKLSDALKHPNWKMGKKISIDSATMMNKVFEIIEAKNIFNLPYKRLNILTHPSSYVHAILKFNDGLTNIILHDTTMKIPIYNTLYSNDNKNLKSKKLNLNIINDLNLKKIDLKKFPLVKIINKLPNKSSLFETVIVSANDKLVEFYLNRLIKFDEIQIKLLKFINNKEFRKYKRIKPKKIENIIDLNEYVRLKIKP